MAFKFHQGFFRCRNPQKYRTWNVKRHDGLPNDVNHIVYRSRWELVLMKKFDESPDVIEWGNEPFPIPYADPTRPRRRCNYWVDFYVKFKRKDGEDVWLIEVKPDSQKKLPQKKKKRTRRYVAESLTYARNVGKWAAAEAFCQLKGWTFKILTEKDLGLG